MSGFRYINFSYEITSAVFGSAAIWNNTKKHLVAAPRRVPAEVMSPVFRARAPNSYCAKEPIGFSWQWFLLLAGIVNERNLDVCRTGLWVWWLTLSGGFSTFLPATVRETIASPPAQNDGEHGDWTDSEGKRVRSSDELDSAVNVEQGHEGTPAGGMMFVCVHLL